MSALRTARFSQKSFTLRGVSFFVLALALATGSPAMAQNFFGPSSTTGPDPITVGSLLDVTDVDLQALDYMQLPFEELLVEVELAGELYTLSLFPYSVRSVIDEDLEDVGTGNLTRCALAAVRCSRSPDPKCARASTASRSRP